jgi:restriction endonuclease S subunit
MSTKKWKFDELGNYCSVINGSTPKTGIEEYWNGNIDWITPTDLGKNRDKYIKDSERKISKLGYNSSNTNMIKKNNIILSTRAPIGHIAINNIDACTNQGCKGIVPNNDINVDFLFYYLKFNKAELDSLGCGATFKELSTNSLLSFMIPVPSIDEQKRIVDIIEEKLKVIEKAKKACIEQISIIEKIFDSYFRKIFSTRKKYELAKINDLCIIERGGSPRPIENYLTNDKNGINWIKIGDAKINSKYITDTAEKIIKEGAKKSRNVKVGDLILSNSMSFGRPYILNIDGCIHDGWLVFSNFSNNINKYYLYYILSSSIVKKQFENKARGAIVKNLNIDIVNEVIIPLPKMTEQENIVEILDEKYTNIEKIKNLLKEQSSYINALPSSILRKAFQGRL